jgi:hypothetical protein
MLAFFAGRLPRIGARLNARHPKIWPAASAMMASSCGDYLCPYGGHFLGVSGELCRRKAVFLTRKAPIEHHVVPYGGLCARRNARHFSAFASG